MPIQQKLAAKLETLQIEKIVRTETIADMLSDQVAAAVGDVLSIVQRTAKKDRRAADIANRLRALPSAMVETASDAMAKLGVWSHSEAGRVVAKTVPRNWMRAAQPAAILVGEDVAGDVMRYDDAIGPISGRRLTDDEWAQWCGQHVWPPPPPEKVTEILQRKTNGVAWQDRMTGLSKLIEPEKTASALIDGFSQGMNIDHLTKKVLPHITGNVASSARRIARTEGLRIANEMQREMYNDLGDLMIGMQIWATLDENTRPEHAARHGQIFYKQGTPGMDLMPSLPDAPNCRCFDIPVLKTPESIANDPKLAADFRTASGNAIPDVQAYGQWFRGADEGRRKMAVGVKRYQTVKDKLGDSRQPDWADFIDPDGKLLTADQLDKETSHANDLRKLAVNDAMDARRQLIQQISTGGFEDQSIRRSRRVVKTTLNSEHSDPITFERVERYRTVDKAAKKELDKIRKAVISAETPVRERRYYRKRLMQKMDRVKTLQKQPATASQQSQLNKLHKDIRQMEQDGHTERAEERARALELLAVPDPATLTFSIGPKVSSDVKRRTDEASRFLSKLVSKKHASNGVAGDGKASLILDVQERTVDHRAQWTPLQRKMELHKTSDAATIVHEMGHALEEYGEVHELAKGFLYHRVKDDPTRQLMTILPEFGYAQHELGRDDEFHKAASTRLSESTDREVKNSAWYTGKQYEGATEVLSVGIEHLYNDPVGFAKGDAEWFRFTVGILRGDLLP